MTSAKDAVEISSYELLSAEPPIGAPVYQDVPDDAEPPVIIIGDVEARSFGDKDARDRIVTLEIVTVMRGDERKPLLALQEKVETRLAGVIEETADWRLHYRFVDDSATLAPDASGYVGLQKFEIIAFRK